MSRMNRRDAMMLAGAATASLLAGPAFAAQKPLKVLLFGGTGFIGPHIV